MDKNTLKWLHIIAFTLMFVGALNWGLVALGFNLVEMLLGGWPDAIKVVYLLVGVSAVYVMVTHKTDCKICSK